MVIQTKSTSRNGLENMNNEEQNISESLANKSKTESASNVLSSLKKRKQSMQTNGPDSLDILRENIQYFFNDKVNALMKDFVQTYFEPAIKNIKENTNESITDQQMKKVCRNLLESCAKSQYCSVNDILSSPSSSSLSSHTPEMNTSETESDTSENGGTSLLHQALKRKRTDSETEQLFKRQFFCKLTAAPPNHYFNTTVTNVVTQQSSGKTVFRPTTSVLTTSSKFEPKFITRPLQSSGTGVFTQTGNTRPIFHIIQSPNRNLKLSATHVELCQLLQQNSSSSSNQQSSSTSNDTSKVTSSNVTIKEELN